MNSNRLLDSSTRRNFWVVAIHGMWATIVAALSLPAAAYLFIPAKMRRKDDWIEAGSISRLVAQVPLEVAYRRNRVDGWRVVSEKSTAWVVKLGDDLTQSSIVAYSPQCTHLGCAYHWDELKTHFICPCHNSIFSIDGRVQDGPAPRPLDRYEVKVEGTKLLLGSLRQSLPTV